MKAIVGLLVQARYRDLEVMTNGVRLSAEELKTAIDDFGATLVYPSDEAYNDIDVVEVVGSDTSKWSVVFPLWTREEGGRSDLSLELTAALTSSGIRVEIENIRVR